MIATVTMNPSLQYYLQVDQLPPNSVIPAKGTLSAIGGEGINVARLMKRMDADAHVLALGLVGGHIGGLIKAELDAEKIAHDFVDTGTEPRVDVTIALTPDRSQVRIRAAGPELELEQAKEVEKKLLALDPAPSYVVLGGSLPGKEVPAHIPKEWYAQLITNVRAKKPEVKFVVDSHAAELGHAVERGPFLVKPNLEELSELAGHKSLSNDKDVLAAAEGLMQRHKVEVVVVSLGKAGAVVVSPKQRFKVIPPEVMAYSSSGAGAALVAGLVLGLEKGESLEQSAKVGTAAGAARAATRTSALPTGAEIEAHLGRVKTEVL